MVSTHGWEALQKEGDGVLVPGVKASQVSNLARVHVRRRVPGAEVAAISTPRGAYVFLVYVPDATTEDDEDIWPDTLD